MSQYDGTNANFQCCKILLRQSKLIPWWHQAVLLFSLFLFYSNAFALLVINVGCVFFDGRNKLCLLAAAE